MKYKRNVEKQRNSCRKSLIMPGKANAKSGGAKCTKIFGFVGAVSPQFILGCGW
jgi:hypothetical protein